MSRDHRFDPRPEPRSRSGFAPDSAPWWLAFGVLVAALGLALQGRPADGQTTTPTTPSQLPAVPAFATGDSNGRMIAVTGVDLTGQSVLYLIDTIDKQLAVYQASGGGGTNAGLRLIGARRIDLDLQLIGYRDRSEYSYKDLEREFSER